MKVVLKEVPKFRSKNVKVSKNTVDGNGLLFMNKHILNKWKKYF